MAVQKVLQSENVGKVQRVGLRGGAYKGHYLKLFYFIFQLYLLRCILFRKTVKIEPQIMELSHVKVEINGKTKISVIFVTSWRNMVVRTDTFLLPNLLYDMWRTFTNKYITLTSLTNKVMTVQKVEKIPQIEVFGDLWRHDTWHTHKTIYILKGVSNIYHFKHFALLIFHKLFHY